MSLKKDKINEDIKSAIKSGSSDEATALRFLNSVIKNKELEKRTRLSKEGKTSDELEKMSELTDEEIISVVLSEIKKVKDSIDQFEKGGRKDLAEKEKSGLEILKRYVPEEMPEEELKSIVKKKIAEMGQSGEMTMKEFGKIMGSVMAEAKGRADGSAVKRLIEEEMNK